jgi:hypothetical protein
MFLFSVIESTLETFMHKTSTFVLLSVLHAFLNLKYFRFSYSVHKYYVSILVFYVMANEILLSVVIIIIVSM